MRAFRVLIILIVALVPIAVLFPGSVAREGVPWRTQFAKNYSAGGYAYFGGKIYAISYGSHTTTSVIGFVSKSGIVHNRYVFQRCFLEQVHYLSPNDPADLTRLEAIRFANPGAWNYDRIKKLYDQQCKSKLAMADRAHRFVTRLKKLAQHGI